MPDAFAKFAAAVVLSIGVAAPQASGQMTLSVKPVKVIVPLDPDSGLDATSRVLALQPPLLLGTPMYVENKPGADGAIAARELIKAAADGRTVVTMAASTMAVNPVVAYKLAYYPQDIRPLAAVTQGGALIVTAPNSRFKSLMELLAAARQSPKMITFATYSPSYRLGMLRFQKISGVQFNEVPYKSPGDALSNVLGGPVDVTIMEFGSGVELVHGGRARALAVTNARRHPKLPQVPTTIEEGVPSFTYYSWPGFAVNSKMPQPIFDKLQEAILEVGKSKEFVQYLVQRGNESYLLMGNHLAAAIKVDLEMNRELILELCK